MSKVFAPGFRLQGGRWAEQRSSVGDANASLIQSWTNSGRNEGQRIPGQARYFAALNVVRPMSRSGGWYGCTGLSMTGLAEQNVDLVLVGRNRASAMLDLYVGQLVLCLGYLRLGVYNLGDAHFRSKWVNAFGSVPLLSRSSVQWTPHLLFAVGTQLFWGLDPLARADMLRFGLRRGMGQQVITQPVWCATPTVSRALVKIRENAK